MMNVFVVELTSESALGHTVNSFFFSSLFENFTYESKHLKLSFHMKEKKSGCSDFKRNFYVDGIILYFLVAKRD